MKRKQNHLKQKGQQENLQQHSAGDTAETKPPFDPMGTNAEFATEIADGRKPNIKVSVKPSMYVGRGGMKMDRGKPANND